MRLELNEIEIMQLQYALIDKINKSNRYQAIALGNLYNKLTSAYDELIENDNNQTRIVKIK